MSGVAPIERGDCVRAFPALVASPSSSLPRSDGNLRRVLCIDHDAVSRQILITALARPGFAIECVCDGQQAFERYMREAGGFDVLVTDHFLPRLDGLMLVRRLRECGFGGGFVVVSDSMNSRDRAAYRSFGVASIFTKPIEPVLLRAAVAAAVSALPRDRSMICAAKASRSPFSNHTSL